MAATCTQDLEYVSTGVAGLDAVLCGGFLQGGFYLLQGDPGSGKTTVALQFLREATREGAGGLYISLTESRHDLERTARSHDWSLDTLTICDLTRSQTHRTGDDQYTIFHPSEVELGQTIQEILSEIERVQPRFLVFDGLAELRLLAGEPLRYRRQMLALKEFFEDRGITALLLDDRTSTLEEIQPESLVGGNIIMEKLLPGYGGARRRLYITKVRSHVFRDGYHDYEICQEGVVVYPRLVAADHHQPFERELFLSKIAGLDEMLNGGLRSGTTTLALGPAGVGKSTIAMQYVVAALERGLRAATYTFDEVLETLFDRSEKLCSHGIRQYVTQGSLQARQVDPAELSPGAFAHEVRRVVEENGVRIVVIDSLNGYLNAMPEERFLPTHLHELFSYLNQRGIVTIMVVAQHGLLGSNMTDMDISYLADTVLLFRYFETRGEIRQAISVFKNRTGPHERTLRELHISSEGVFVGEPLRNFHGIMTGVPEIALNTPTSERSDFERVPG